MISNDVTAVKPEITVKKVEVSAPSSGQKRSRPSGGDSSAPKRIRKQPGDDSTSRTSVKPTPATVVDAILQKMATAGPVTVQEISSSSNPHFPRDMVQSVLDILVILGIAMQVRYRDPLSQQTQAKPAQPSTLAPSGSKQLIPTAKPYYCFAGYAKFPYGLGDFSKICELVKQKIQNIEEIQKNNLFLSELFLKPFASTGSGAGQTSDSGDATLAKAKTEKLRVLSEYLNKNYAGSLYAKLASSALESNSICK